MIKIKKYKRIFEDNNTQQQPVANQNNGQPAATAQPTLLATNTQQQPANNNQQLPANTQQLSAPLPQQPQENPNKQKVEDILNKMKEGYWVMSVNLPDEILKSIPDFKEGNQAAAPAIKCWNDFKQQPNELTFKAFVNAFAAFGGVLNLDGLNNQQQPAQQPVTQPQPTNNINAGAKAAYSFRRNLMENLETANRKNYYNRVVEDYFDKSEFTLY